jgi:PAS domain-containing protein
MAMPPVGLPAEAQAVLAALSGAVAVFGPRGELRFHNHTWLQFGLPAGEAASSSDSGANSLAALIVRTAAGVGDNSELLDRGPATYELRASLFLLPAPAVAAGDAGESRFILVQAFDVTKHIRAERGQREADSVLMAILDTADVGLCLIDQRGRFSTVNRAYCALFGYQPEELIGRLHTRVLMSEEHEHARRLFERFIAGQNPSTEVSLEPAYEPLQDSRGERSGKATRPGPVSSELRGRRHDGGQIDLLLSARLLIRGDGRRFLVCSVLDITERKEKSRELEERAQLARAEAAQKSQLLSELDQKLALIEEQHRQIIELSAPVLDLWDGILVLPIIGGLSAERAGNVTERLLNAVVERRAQAVILDLTSARQVAGGGLEFLIRMVRAVRLLGTRALLTGLTPETARELVQRGLTIDDIPALRSLGEGLRLCMSERQNRSKPVR